MPRPIPKPADPIKQLTIKIKTIERLIKEVNYYKAEVQENEQKLEQMKQDPNKDQYDIKKFQEVLDESYMMVPDSESRWRMAVEDLKEFRTQFLLEMEESSSMGEEKEEMVKEMMLKAKNYCEM